MNKVKVLFSAAAVVAIVAGFAASKANNHAIFIESNPQANPQFCDLRVPAKTTLTPSASGIYATLVSGPCTVKVLTGSVAN